MKTVAIVGTHPNTRELAPYHNHSVDIWAFNNQPVQGWMPRCNALFDIHHPNDIHRRRLEHPPFDEFLKKAEIPIYTPHPIPDCPANKIYPIDEVCADLFPKFKRGQEPVKYFTSGPAYALALAIHLGYERIEFYGIEMESNSEYIYQRDGIGLMFGIAIARGIEVIIPDKSMMFYAPLYGYEDDSTKIDREAFETRASELQMAMEQTFAAHNAAKGDLDNVEKRIAEMQARGIATPEIQAQMEQEYIRTRTAYEQSIANHAFVNGQYLDCRAWQARVEKAMEFAGRAHELQALNHDKWDRVSVKEELGVLGKAQP